MPKLAALIHPEAETGPDGFAGETSAALAVPLPDEVAKVTGLRVHDTLDTNPTVQFTDIGDYIIGRYQGMRELSISGRQQSLYDLRTPSGVVVSVWGSTILDSRMVTAMKAGLTLEKSLCIQYLGTIDTGKGNPAKNFRVAWK